MPLAHRPLPAPLIDSLLLNLERAVADHLAWLERWHTDLLCDGTMPPEEAEPGGHRRCGFGRWLARLPPHDRALAHIERLEELHTAMHRHAEAMAASVGGGRRIDRALYRAFMDAVLAFNEEARRLSDGLRQSQAETDSLTGLHNRQALAAHLVREHERFVRSGQPCVVAIADLDDFKAINDTYGHRIGDQVLQAAARHFLHNIRAIDLVFRYGGEEFLFILPHTDLDHARKILDRLRVGLARRPTRLPDGREVRATASFGMAEMERGVDVGQTIDAADRALYRAKSRGRNRVCARDEAGPAMPPPSAAQGGR